LNHQTQDQDYNHHSMPYMKEVKTTYYTYGSPYKTWLIKEVARLQNENTELKKQRQVTNVDELD